MGASLGHILLECGMRLVEKDDQIAHTEQERDYYAKRLEEERQGRQSEGGNDALLQAQLNEAHQHLTDARALIARLEQIKMLIDVMPFEDAVAVSRATFQRGRADTARLDFLDSLIPDKALISTYQMNERGIVITFTRPVGDCGKSMGVRAVIDIARLDAEKREEPPGC